MHAKGKPAKVENRLNREEKSDTYLTYVYRLPWSVESLEKINKKLELSSAGYFYSR